MMIRPRLSRALLAVALAAMVLPLQQAQGGGLLQIKCLAQGHFYGTLGTAGFPPQLVWYWRLDGGGTCIEHGKQLRTLEFLGASLCTSYPGPVTGDPRQPYNIHGVGLYVTTPETGEVRTFSHIWYLGSLAYLPDLDAGAGVRALGAATMAMNERFPGSRYVPIGEQVGAGALLLGKATVTDTTSVIPATFVFTFGENGIPGTDAPDTTCV